MVVIADDQELEWPHRVLANAQRFVLGAGSYVQRMMARVRQYHLDDAPDLRSCNPVLKALPGTKPPGPSLPITDPDRLDSFHGLGTSM